MLILLFVLVSLDKNSSLQDSLRTFLGFYKENRELITALMGGAGAPAAAPASSPQTTKPSTMPEVKEEKSRPATEVDSLSILEQYLKRSAV